MSDGKKSDDALEENLRRLLPPVLERQAPDPAFRERLALALQGAVTPPVPVPRPRRRLARVLPNALAFAAAAALVLLVLRSPALPPLPPPTALRDGATLSYWPGRQPVARLQGGYLRLEPAVPFRVLAGDLEFSVGAGSVVLLELVRVEEIEKGERSMRPLWLVPSAAAGAGLTLAVLVARGQVSFMGGAHAELPPN